MAGTCSKGGKDFNSTSQDDEKNISRSTCTSPQQGGFQMESALMHWFFHSWTKKTKHSNFSFKKKRSWLCCFHGCISAFLQRSIQNWNSCRMFSPLYQPHPHHLRKKKNNRRCRRIYAGTISERLILTDELCRNKNMMQPFFLFTWWKTEMLDRKVEFDEVRKSKN